MGQSAECPRCKASITIEYPSDEVTLQIDRTDSCELPTAKRVGFTLMMIGITFGVIGLILLLFGIVSAVFGFIGFGFVLIAFIFGAIGSGIAGSNRHHRKE